MQELRCGSKLHGLVVDGHTIETKCDSRFCGADSEHTVLHRFNIQTLEYTTERFTNPPQPRREVRP